MREKKKENMKNKDEIDVMECALIDCENLESHPRRDLGKWGSSELRELKRHCSYFPDFGPVLYRGLIALQNNWSYSAGRLDDDTIKQIWGEYENSTL